MISTDKRSLATNGGTLDRSIWPMDAAPLHKPVLLKEAMEGLAIHTGGTYVDCTTGGGGHTEEILERCLPGGRVLALDSDSNAIDVAQRRLNGYQLHFSLVHGSYTRLRDIIATRQFGSADGILFDLGLSSLQLEASGRGFSFRRNEPLDMRFDNRTGPTAADIVNSSHHEELARILRTYGEEPRASSIARILVEHRPFDTATQLANVVTRVASRSKAGIHPATRTFQALRIAVNKELDSLQTGLEQAITLLKPGGRLVVISYHSLEDRIVKNTFRRESKGCICPPEVPQCICDHVPQLRIITRKVITPSANEKVQNPRSRSARMRVAEHLQGISL